MRPPLLLPFAVAMVAFTQSPGTSRAESESGLPEPLLDLSADSLTAPEGAEIIEAHGHKWVASPEALRHSLPSGTLPRRGALVVDFMVHGASSTLTLPPQEGQLIGGELWALPFVNARLFVTRGEDGSNSNAGINFVVKTVEDTEKQNQLRLSRLDGGKPYQLVLNWDADSDILDAFLQGVQQGDMAHWQKEVPAMAFADGGELRLGGAIRYQQNSSALWAVRRARIFPTSLDPAQAAALARADHLPPMDGEARTVYEGALELADRPRELLFEQDFSQPLSLEREEELLNEAGERKTLPQAEWILEGPKVQVETTPKGLVMRTEAPDDRKWGHWVLWLNREFPDGLLVEYEFSAKSDGKGLHILFLGTHYPEGETIFDLGLPARKGDFRPYIMGEINSYHISPWAADDASLRRTANMRKNSGFALAAVGNDVIGGSGKDSHKIRAVIEDGFVAVESNGVLSIRYQDDGETRGPVWNQGGYIGFRFMAHTEEATLRNLRVYRLLPE